MSDNIKQKTYALQAALTEDPSFLQLKQTLAMVKQDPASYGLVVKMMELQKNVQEKMNQGVAPTQEEQQMAQMYMQQLQANPLTNAYLQAEYTFSELVTKVNDIISDPLKQLFYT